MDKGVVFQQTRKRFNKKKPEKPVSSDESGSSSDDEEFTEKVMKKNFGDKDKVAKKKGDAKATAKAPKRTTTEAEFVDSSDEEGRLVGARWGDRGCHLRSPRPRSCSHAAAETSEHGTRRRSEQRCRGAPRRRRGQR